TITDADFPGIGVTLYQGVDTVLPIGLDLGLPSTTAQTWNFQSLETDSLFEFTFQDPATAPHGDDFPEAEVAVDQFGGSGFVNVTSSVAEIIGFAGDNFQGFAVDISAEFTDPYQLLSFPTTMSTSFTDNAVLDITIYNDGFIPAFPPIFDPDSVRLKRTSSITSEIDAFGTLTDALGDSHDVLRQFFVEESIDSVFYYQGGNWAMIPALVFENPMLDTTRNIRFLSATLGYAVADFSVNENMGPTRATFLSDPSLCCTSVEETTQAAFNLVYPNPSNGTITLSNVDAGSTLELLDLSGKNIFVTSLKTGSQGIDISALPNGLYIFKLYENDGSIKTGRLSLLK
ncbi:MAG: hypothetical protein ACI97X_002220, partial [Oceanospirillaceae bacterium]